MAIGFSGALPAPPGARDSVVRSPGPLTPELSPPPGAPQDPSIKAMAEQMSKDPQFQALTRQMAGSMGPAGASQGEGSGDTDGTTTEAAAGGMPAFPGMPGGGMGNYMQAMQSLVSNPGFMQMAEKIGQQIMKDPNMAPFMGAMQDPSMQSKMQERVEKLRDHPELGAVIKDMQEGGMEGMMKHWNNPDILAKFGEAMQDVIPQGGEAGAGAGAAEDEGPAADTIMGAASDGDVAKLKELLAKDGADVNEADEEGRTALHFACGYGEAACAEELLAASADVDRKDKNNNTALHYAAGYGQADMVKLLLGKGADRDVKNDDGKTAQEVAELNEQKEVLALFSKSDK